MQWASAWPSMIPPAVGFSALKKNRPPTANLALHVEFQCYQRGSDQQMILGSLVVVETKKSTQELVALSGAHTLGSKGFGNPISFDNAYFKILLEKPWSSSAGMSSMIGLPTDRALVEDDECLRWISMYANNQDLFFEDFKNVYIKLVNTGAVWKPSL